MRGMTSQRRSPDATAREEKMRREQVESLYQQYAAALVAYTCSLVIDRAQAEDLVQQVFLKLLGRSFAEPDNPRAYLYRAVRNAAFNVRRSSRRDVELDAKKLWLVAPSSAVEQALALQGALLELAEEQREVVMLHVWSEMTFEEIGKLAGIPANTAASRYRYGLAKLRERMTVHEVNENAAQNATKR